ncbi:MAG: F0F1 ATP synthase subunit gamma, partial [Gammaproteobacteria bacterium]|nr:F0F1 ATP synthase subunit gamma [Gammaproteobacteria bacterium]
MASAKEVRTKIASIKNTQKITKAMEMVAASKMRKAQERMREARPYAEKIRNVIAHLGNANPEYKHSYLGERDEVKRIGIIIVSSDRGLCGGLNSNLFRETISQMKEWNDKDIEIDTCLIGTRAVSFFTRVGGTIVGQSTHIGDKPAVDELIGTVKIMLDSFNDEKIDQLYLISNKFINSMTQEPTVEQLLPVQASDEDELKHHWDYIYEPDAKEVLDHLLTRYIESLVYQGVIENVACEQA